MSTTVDNLFEFFPESIVVEYNNPGSDERLGADWHSRRIVVEQHEGQWYVVGLAEDYWSIYGAGRPFRPGAGHRREFGAAEPRPQY